MSEDNDTVAGDEQDDTLQADAGQDTTQAAADDTLAADAGDDTVSGAAQADPFEQFDEPPAVDPTPVGAAPVAASSDELDREVEAAEQAIEADPTDPEALKRLVAANRKARQRNQERAKVETQRAAVANENAAYEKLIRSAGLPDAPKEVRDKLTKTVIYKRFEKHFKAAQAELGSDEEARAEAKANLRTEIRQIIAAAQPKQKVPPRIKRTDTGATLHPPGGGVGGRPAKEQPNPAEVFVKGNWTYPTPVALDN